MIKACEDRQPVRIESPDRRHQNAPDRHGYQLEIEPVRRSWGAPGDRQSKKANNVDHEREKEDEGG